MQYPGLGSPFLIKPPVLTIFGNETDNFCRFLEILDVKIFYKRREMSNMLIKKGL